jgi:hypothetical protein
MTKSAEEYEKEISDLRRELAMNELRRIGISLDDIADELRDWVNEEPFRQDVLGHEEWETVGVVINNIAGAAGFLHSLVFVDEPVRASCGNLNKPHPDDDEICGDEGAEIHIHDGLRCLAIIDVPKEERNYPGETEAARKKRYDVLRKSLGIGNKES